MTALLAQGRSKERKASGSGGLLAPPPSAGLLPKPGSFKAPIAAASASSAESIWDDFGSASSSSATAVKSPPAAADPWGDLGSFGEPSKRYFVQLFDAALSLTLCVLFKCPRSEKERVRLRKPAGP